MKKEKNILRAALCKMLLAWRKITILCVCFGIIFGGIRLFIGIFSWDNNMQQFHNDLEVYNQELKQSKETLESLEQAYDENVQKVADQETYLQNSILMNLDPKQKPQVSADIWIRLDSPIENNSAEIYNNDPADTLIDLYCTYINQQMDWDRIATESGIQKEYIRELVKVTEQMEYDIINITVSNPDTDVAQKIIEAITNELANYRNELVVTIKEHSLIIANIVPEIISDQELSENQNWQRELLSTYKQEVEDTENQINENYYPSWPTSEPSRREICFDSVLAGITGIIVSLLIIFFSIYIKYNFDGKIHTIDAIEDICNIPCLGVFIEKTKYQKQNKKLQVIDKWIEKKIGITTDFEDDVINQLFALNIKNNTENIKKLLLVGTKNIQKFEIEKISLKLKKSLENIEISIAKTDNLYQEILESEGVLLIEKINGSRIVEISKEKELAEILTKRVIGYVVI